MGRKPSCGCSPRNLPVVSVVFRSLLYNLQLGLGGSSAANQMSTCDLVAAANRFVALLPTSNQTALLRVRQPTVLNFSEATFPRRLRGKPVFYPFSGVDLLNARLFFPSSRMYHLVANIQVGDVDCLCRAACVSTAFDVARGFLDSWASFHFARLSTGRMEGLAASQQGGSTIGVFPALLLNLALDFSGPVEVVGLEYGSTGNGSGSVLRLQTRQFSVTYRSLILSLTPEDTTPQKDNVPELAAWRAGSAHIDEQLQALRHTLSDGAHGGSGSSHCGSGFVTIFKSAPHWICSASWMARWVLQNSVAVLQDETGLQPLQYDSIAPARWLTRCAGHFVSFFPREASWYTTEAPALKSAFPGPQLPFQFGYGIGGKSEHGVLLAAWRESCASEELHNRAPTAFTDAGGATAAAASASNSGRLLPRRCRHP